MKNKVIIAVAVRLKSSRLTQKAFADLCGQPLIIRLTERMRQAKTASDIVWCTSTHPQDDALQQLAKNNDINCYRGSELDVMSRFIDVAIQRDADIVVRVTGDNPLTDPEMLDFMVSEHIQHAAEYTYTEDFPVGTRCEVIDVAMLKWLHDNLQDPNSSEYMTYMLNRPDKIKTLSVSSIDSKIIRPNLRLTVDTPEDLQLLERIYHHFNGMPPKLAEIIHFLDAHSELLMLNNNLEITQLPETINCDLK